MDKLTKLLGTACMFATLSVAFSATAENYEAKICYNCSEVEARSFALAREFEPELMCYADDVFSPDFSQSCYSQPNQVLVANASTGQVWGFDIFHDNQGSAEYEIELKAQRFTVSGQAKKLMTDILTTYSELDAVIASVNRDLESPSTIFDNTANASLGLELKRSVVGTYSSSNCSDNSNTARAVRAAFDSQTLTNLLDYVQADYKNKYPNPESEFTYSRFNGGSFSAGAGGIGIGGSWEFISVNRLLEANFPSDVPGSPANKVVYNVYMERGAIDVDVNEASTRIGGFSISSLRRGGAINVNACLLEKLNQYIKASVQSDPVGGNFGDSSPVDYGRGRGFIPQSSGSGGGIETCTWRFYDSQGEQMFSMQGPCP